MGAEAHLPLLQRSMLQSTREALAGHPAILDLMKHAPSSAIDIRVLSTKTIEVTIRLDNETATQSFFLDECGSDVSYIHPAGLRILMDFKVVKFAEQCWAIVTKAELFRPIQPVPWTKALLKFFQLLDKYSFLSFPSIPGGVAVAGVPPIGKYLKAIAPLCDALELRLAEIFLADIEDEEFRRAVEILSALLLDNVSVVEGSALMFGPAVDLLVRAQDQNTSTEDILNEVPCRQVRIRVPLVVNWKEIGVVIWLESEAEAFLHNDVICGVRLGRQHSWTVEKGKRFKKSAFPEVWLFTEWPAIEIGSQQGINTFRKTHNVTFGVQFLSVRFS